MTGTSSPSVSTILAEELQQVETARDLRLGRNPDRPSAKDSLIGLAFSGGGIRSATFNLGILQALARTRLLRAFDYVSTVSGGGYIGGWLMAWMHHQEIGIHEVEARLTAPPRAPQQSADPPEVHFLREYSNYLTPRKGLLSADFWAFAASYLRNTMLNQIILVLALLSLLMAPRGFVSLLNLLERLEEALRGRFSDVVQTYMESQYFALGLGLVLTFIAVVFIDLNLASIASLKANGDANPLRCGEKKDKYCWFTNERAVQLLIVCPSVLAAALFTYGLGQFLPLLQILEQPFRAPLLGGLLYVALWAVAVGICELVRVLRRGSRDEGPNPWWVLSTAALAGTITGYLFVPFTRILIPGGGTETLSKWAAMTVGTPLMIGIMLITGVLHIGLMGLEMTDAHREWWGRLGGWLIIYGVCWFALFGIAVYFPVGLGYLLNSFRGHALTFSGVVVWIASTAYGVNFGKSEQTSKPVAKGPFRHRVMHYLARATPYVFILGLLLGLSLLAAVVAKWITDSTAWTLARPTDFDCDPGLALICLVFLAGAVLVSWRVDINEFSIHYLYRNRLIRCYLGASVEKRSAQPFTGFSEDDNLALSKLQIPPDAKEMKDARPLPIINTSLNVARGSDLALQTRKARSFAFTPLYGGFTRHSHAKNEWESFFGPTKEAGCQLRGYPDGITLGTSVAISGAAASPNMGSYSEPSLAFLMTLFDVRLGCWIGNPARMEKPLTVRKSQREGSPKRKYWQRGGPMFGFWRLLCELLGSTTDDSSYVYLSDGGHFENLAIYELVRRQCRLIVACDASCDAGRAMGDLHNAMERCRTDFGVDIVLDDVERLVPETGPGGVLRSQAHFVTGTIRYPGADGEGRIVYIKPSLVDGDPQDVLAYQKTNNSFPNDTTANQWFDEAHFENYRALGEAAGTAAAESIADVIQGGIGYEPELKAA